MAAVARSIDASNNVVSAPRSGTNRVGTEYRVGEKPGSLFTEVPENYVKIPIAPSVGVAEVQMELPAPGVKFVDAVIGDIRRETVAITCFTNSGDVEINLPAGMIPQHLLSFGAPVRISLDETLGYRAPKIEGRVIDPQEKVAGQAEFESWFDRL